MILGRSEMVLRTVVIRTRALGSRTRARRGSAWNTAWQRTGILAFLLPAACADSGNSSTRYHLLLGNCPTCSVEAREVWSSLPEDPNVVDVGTYIQVRQTLLTMQGFAGHSIVGFDLATSRSFVFDRPGEGPGEFKDIMAGLLDDTGDTLVVADSRRVSFLTTDLRFVRSFNSPVSIPPRSLIELPNGDFLVSSLGPRLNHSGMTHGLHRLSRSGELLSTFAPVDVSDKPRLASSDQPGHTWLLFSQDDGFSMQLWDVETETLINTFTIRPPWWHSSTATPHEHERQARSGRLPGAPSTIATDAVEHGGVLWVRISHADEHWQEWDPDIYDPTALYDAVLIAVEPDTGDPLATRVFSDVYVVAFVEGGRIASYELEGPGYPRIRLYDIWLER